MKFQVWPLSPPVHQMGKVYDLAIGSIGYESRASFFFSNFAIQADLKCALVFLDQQVLSFSSNRAQFSGLGFDEDTATIEAVERCIKRLKSEKDSSESSSFSILIDISSMTRLLIASICLALQRLSDESAKEVSVDFVYSIAEFGPIPDVDGPIVANGPVLNTLGGWPKVPGAPCGLILGIGYEQDLALGMIEELEPGAVWAFRPKDHDTRYDTAIKERNRGLFTEVPASNVVRYSVFDPLATFSALDSLVALSKEAYRLILVPLGPKIFALSSCLVALRHYPEVGLWRVSGGVNTDPVERSALGPVLGLNVKFLGRV